MVSSGYQVASGQGSFQQGIFDMLLNSVHDNDSLQLIADNLKWTGRRIQYPANPGATIAASTIAAESFSFGVKGSMGLEAACNLVTY